MLRDSWMRRLGWLVGVALMLTSAGAALADGPGGFYLAGDEPPLFPPDVDSPFHLFFGEPEPIELSDYWLGLECRPVPPSLRAQLKLSEDEGLLVEQVAPDSPAAKVGLEQYDVLLKADGKPLGKLQDLIDAVDAAKDKGFSLERVHGGKRAEITVKPAKRPELHFAQPHPKTIEDPTWDRMRQYLYQFRPGEGGKPPWRLRFWGPGAILPPDAKAHTPLPGNMSVAITRRGDEPAKIVVKRGEEKWEVAEDELDKLPDDVRSHVERALGRIATHRPSTPRSPDGKVWSHDFDFVPDWPTPHWGSRPEGRVDKRLEEMNRRIEELRKSIDELREKRPRLKDKEARPPKDEKPDEKPDRA